MTEHFNARCALFHAWLAKQTLNPIDPHFEAWKVDPGYNSLYTGYISVPRKMHTSDEFRALIQYLKTPSSSVGEQQAKYYIYKNVTARFSNLINDDIHDVLNIISIGANCLPKFIATKWGLTKPRILGGSTMALDLALGEPEKVLALVTEDFAGLLDEEQLSYNEVANCPINEKSGYIFNHEAGLQWATDGYAKLKSRYHGRIANFRNAIANGKPTIFVFDFYTPSTAKTINLARQASLALAQRTVGPSACLFVLTAANEASRDIECSWNNSLTKIIYDLNPFQSYSFFDPNHYATSDGLILEAKIVSAIRDLALLLKPKMLPISLGLDLDAGLIKET